MMEEEQRRFIRIDPHKVQQKIYDLYPTNSVVRRNLIAAAKAKEIENLSRALEDVPVKVAQDALKKNTKLILGTTIYGIGLVSLSIGLWVYGLGFHKTHLEEILSLVLGTLLMTSGIENLKDVWYLRSISAAFNKSMENMKSRINELKK